MSTGGLKTRESCLQEFALLRRFHLTEVCGLSSLHRPAGINRNNTLNMLNGAKTSDYGHLCQVVSYLQKKNYMFSVTYFHLILFTIHLIDIWIQIFLAMIISWEIIYYAFKACCWHFDVIQRAFWLSSKHLFILLVCFTVLTGEMHLLNCKRV